MKYTRRFIDWKKTGKTLQLLRNDNLNLRKYVCSARNKATCGAECECDGCYYEMDSNVSRSELAEVFGVSESVIFNWETGKTPVSLEDMIFYSDVSGVELDKLIVFNER